MNPVTWQHLDLSFSTAQLASTGTNAEDTIIRHNTHGDLIVLEDFRGITADHIIVEVI
jgi:hypothetical protein